MPISKKSKQYKDLKKAINMFSTSVNYRAEENVQMIAMLDKLELEDANKILSRIYSNPNKPPKILKLNTKASGGRVIEALGMDTGDEAYDKMVKEKIFDNNVRDADKIESRLKEVRGDVAKAKEKEKVVEGGKKLKKEKEEVEKLEKESGEKEETKREQFIEGLRNLRRNYSTNLNKIKQNLTNEERVKFNNELKAKKEKIQEKNKKYKLGLYTPEGVDYLWVIKELDDVIEQNSELITTEELKPKEQPKEETKLDIQDRLNKIQKTYDTNKLTEDEMGKLVEAIKTSPESSDDNLMSLVVGDKLKNYKHTKGLTRRQEEGEDTHLTTSKKEEEAVMKTITKKRKKKIPKREEFIKLLKESYKKQVPKEQLEYVEKKLNEIQKDYDTNKLTEDELEKLGVAVSKDYFRSLDPAVPTQSSIELIERVVGKGNSGKYRHTKGLSRREDIGEDTHLRTSEREKKVVAKSIEEFDKEIAEAGINVEELKKGRIIKVDTKPIELPVNYTFKDEELKERNEEGGWQMNRQNKGTQRPKFITPSVNVLQPSEQAKQAQYDEWAIFDFVKPEEEGASGNLGNNPLKRMVDTEHETIMRNAGIDLDPALSSVFKDRMIDTNQEQLKADMLPPLMPDTSKEPRQVYDVSEYEVKSYDVNNDRTAIEMASPYDNMTPIVLTNEEVRKSILYGRVP